MLNKDNLKQIVISIVVGAFVAFFSTLFNGLAEFFKSHSTEMVAGGATSFFHIIRNLKA